MVRERIGNTMLKFHASQEEFVEIVFNPYTHCKNDFFPDWLYRFEISPGAKIAYSMLCRLAGKSGKAFPSQSWLAENVRMGVRTIGSHIAELINARLIKTQSRGRGHSLIYYFLWHPVMGPMEKYLDSAPSDPDGGEPAQDHYAPLAKIAEGGSAISATINVLMEEFKKILKLAGLHKFSENGQQLQEQQAGFFAKSQKKEKNIALRRAPDLRIAERFPHLAATGFGQSQINQLFPTLTGKLGLDAPELTERLVRSCAQAEEMLAHGPLADRYGHPVKSPKNYVFSALATDGCFNPPASWVPPAVLEAQKREEMRKQREKDEAEKEKVANTLKDNAHFEQWFGRLSPIELRDLARKKEAHPTNRIYKKLKYWLRAVYWPQNVKTQRAFSYV